MDNTDGKKAQYFVFNGKRPSFQEWAARTQVVLLALQAWNIILGVEKEPVLPPNATDDQITKYAKEKISYDDRSAKAYGAIVTGLPTDDIQQCLDQDPKDCWEYLQRRYGGKSGNQEAYLNGLFMDLVAIYKVDAGKYSPPDKVIARVTKGFSIILQLVHGKRLEDNQRMAWQRMHLLACLNMTSHAEFLTTYQTSIKPNTDPADMLADLDHFLNKKHREKPQRAPAPAAASTSARHGANAATIPNCGHCGKPGHVEKQCWTKKNKEKKEQANAVAAPATADANKKTHRGKRGGKNKTPAAVEG